MSEAYSGLCIKNNIEEKTMKRNKKATRNLNVLKGKLTLRQFSDKCGIGQSTMHNYLKGRALRSPFIEKICQAYGCTADWLLGLKKGGKDEDAQIKLSYAVNELKAGMVETKKLIKQLEV